MFWALIWLAAAAGQCVNLACAILAHNRNVAFNQRLACAADMPAHALYIWGGGGV